MSRWEAFGAWTIWVFILTWPPNLALLMQGPKPWSVAWLCLAWFFLLARGVIALPWFADRGVGERRGATLADAVPTGSAPSPVVERPGSSPAPETMVVGGFVCKTCSTRINIGSTSPMSMHVTCACGDLYEIIPNEIPPSVYDQDHPT